MEITNYVLLAILTFITSLELYNLIRSHRRCKTQYTLYINKDFIDDVCDKVLEVTTVPKNKEEAVIFALRLGRLLCEEKLATRNLREVNVGNGRKIYIN